MSGVDLAQWLTAQLDEDTRIVREANTSPEMVTGIPRSYAAAPVALHIAEFASPARVLREIEAKRRIVAAHERRPMPKGDTADCAHCWGAVWPCPTLRLLASVYDDRDGYQEGWAP